MTTTVLDTCVCYCGTGQAVLCVVMRGLERWRETEGEVRGGGEDSI